MVNPLGSVSTSSKAFFSKEVKGCYAQDSLVRSYLLLQEEQFLKEYEAITTWGSVFSNPTLKPSHIH